MRYAPAAGVEWGSMTYQELCKLSEEELQRQPCDCDMCATCEGTGRLYLRQRLDFSNDDDWITCDECERGITQACDRCAILTELEHDKISAEEA